jgi:CRP-like cAMP-binding protein
MQINTTTLAAQPFLKGLSERQLEVLVGDAMPAEFKTGELIFSEGGPANRFFLLLSGKVALESSPEEREDERDPMLIETIGAGSVLGWSWLFPPYFWHFDARAVTPVKAIFFYGTRLREQCENDHDLGYELMKRTAEVTIERLQATRRRLWEQNKNLLLPM